MRAALDATASERWLSVSGYPFIFSGHGAVVDVSIGCVRNTLSEASERSLTASNVKFWSSRASKRSNSFTADGMRGCLADAPESEAISFVGSTRSQNTF